MDTSVNFELRPAVAEDFEFAWSLFRDLVKPLAVELKEWNEPGQERIVEDALADKCTSIILVSGANAGWLQVVETTGTVYLGHIYVVPSLQNRGIGTAVLRQLIDRARREGMPLMLDVMNNNRAKSLYERLGFRAIGTFEYKVKMLWQEGLPCGLQS